MLSDFDASTWLVLTLIAGWCVLSMLHVLAHRFERERNVHDLKLRVNSLRGAYAAKLAEMAAREYGGAAPASMSPISSPQPSPATAEEIAEVVAIPKAIEVPETNAQSRAA